MAEVNLEKNSFVAGEVTDRLFGRTDLAQYGQGCRRLENSIVLPHGGVMGRPGFRYVNTVKYPGRRTRLIPFQVSTEASYIIEAGDLYFRFYVNGGLLLDGGNNPVEVVTPYDQNDVFLLQWAQEADVMYIVHPTKQVYKLSRTSVTSFTLDQVTWNKGRQPIGPLNVDPDNYILANAPGTTYERRITMVSDTFTVDDVGRTFFFRLPGTPGFEAWWTIRQFISSTVIEADIDYQFNGGGTVIGVDTWRWGFGLFDDANGCNAVSFHQGRLVFGGFTQQVDYLAFSVSDDFENFQLESTDDDLEDSDSADRAITRRTVDSQVNAIRWIQDVEGLLIVGTSGAEFQVRGDNEDSLTPLGTIIKRVTRRGSTQIDAVVVDNKIFFVERSNAVIRRFGYVASGSSASLSSANFSILSEHLLKDGGGAVDLVYSQYPLSQLWIPTNDGTLISWAYEDEQDVSGPGRHILGGNFLGKNPRVESCAVSESSVPFNTRSAQSGFVGPATSSITNPGLEAGNLTGWTSTGGSWEARNTPIGTIPGAQEGSWFLYRLNGPDTTEEYIHNTLDLTTLSGWNNILVDDGSTTVTAGGWVNITWAAARLRFRVIALDALDNELADIFNGDWEAPTAGTWFQREAVDFQLPPTTRKIRWELGGRLFTTSSAGMALDNIYLTVNQEPFTPTQAFERNEDRLWIVTKRTVDGSTTRHVEYLETPWGVDLPRDATDLERVNRLDHVFRVDSGLTLDAPVLVNDVTAANPPTVSADGHGFSNGDRVFFRNIVGMIEIDHTTFVVQNSAANSFDLHDLNGNPVDGTGFGTFIANDDSYVYGEVQSVSGLDHLEGETVAVVEDGVSRTDKVVSGGVVTLDTWASLVHVGLPFSSYVTTMVAFFNGPAGSDLGYEAAVPQVTANFVDTLGLEFGRGDNPTTWETLPWTPYIHDRVAPPFTGFKQISMNGADDEIPAVSFRQTQPYPFIVNALYVRYESQPI